MRVVSWNLNGIRAAYKKGLDPFIRKLDADVLLFQEVRALPEQMPSEWKQPPGYKVMWHPAIKKGYSGVMTCSKNEIIEIGRGIATDLDETPDPEGRVLVTRHGNFTCINMYLPNGSSSPQRQHYKDRWLEDMLVWSQDFLRDSNPVVLCGDLNIAHNENDIWNPIGNRGTSGFLDHEREWFDRLLKSGWKDLVRSHYGERKGPYSWWSNRGRARELDRGWRIDYILANQAASKQFVSAEVVREGGLSISDHAPVMVDFSEDGH